MWGWRIDEGLGKRFAEGASRACSVRGVYYDIIQSSFLQRISKVEYFYKPGSAQAVLFTVEPRWSIWPASRPQGG